LFDLALSPPWGALLAGGAGGVQLSLSAGWSGTRRILRTPPALALREG
jgi:putative ABC transport system permease protein